MYYSDLSNIQIKLSIDLQQTYEAYQDARRKLDRYAGGMTWKTVNGQDYLIKIINRRGATKSLGPRSDETAALHAEFVAGKARAKAREPGKGQRDRLQAKAVMAPARDRFSHLPLGANAERMFPAHVRPLTRDKGYAL